MAITSKLKTEYERKLSPSTEPPNRLVKSSLLGKLLLRIRHIATNSKPVRSTTIQVNLVGLSDVVGEQTLNLEPPSRGHHGVDFCLRIRTSVPITHLKYVTKNERIKNSPAAATLIGLVMAKISPFSNRLGWAEKPALTPFPGASRRKA